MMLRTGRRGDTTAAPSVSYLYDVNTKGTLPSAATSLGGTIYSHDKLGRVIASTQTTNGTPYGFSYSYSRTDQLTGETYPSGRTVNYGFDPFGRVNSVTGPSPKAYVSNITYKPASIPSGLSLANGLTETYTWNERLQLTGLNAGSALALNIYPCDQGYTSCSTGNTGGTWRETITTNGALNAVQEFRHDSLNRLFTASEKTAPFTAGPTCPDSGSVWCRQFNYDAPGNRTISGRSPSGSEAWDVSSISSTTNQIQDAGWSYDAAGNVIAANNAGNSVAIRYDAENRQVALCAPYSASCTNTPGTGVTVYYYDGEGRRVEQIDPVAGTTVFVYDAFGNLVADYGALPVAPSTGTEYVTVDDVGTTRLVTDSQGNVLERHDFEPFGHELMGSEAGIWRSTVAGYGVTPTAVRQQFTGQERDNTGLDFFQARYFSSAQGRFSSVDPANAGASLGDPQSWNGYSYASNSPLAYTDPSGLGIFGDIFGILGGMFGGPLGAFLGGVAGNGLDAAIWGPQAGGSPGFYNPTNNFGLGNAGGLPGLMSGQTGGGVYGSGSNGGVIFSATITSFPTADVSSILQGIQSAATAVPPSPSPAPKPRNKALNQITAVFGYDQNIPLPSCFGIAMKSTLDHLNPFSPDLSSAGEAAGAFYTLSKYNQAVQYAASTPSRTFGTQFLVQPYKSSVYRGLLKQSGRGALAGFLFSVDTSLSEGLYDEIQAMKQGRCQQSYDPSRI